MLRALIWDVDGTIAETELDGHRVAFNLAFKEFGLCWRWGRARYLELLQVTGGRERLLHDLAQRPPSQVPAGAVERERLVRALHQRKNQLYAQRVARGEVRARPGVLALMAQARAAGLQQAIATTTSRGNVQALMSSLLGERWRAGFAAVVCGEDVERKKPDPQVYHQALAQLGVAAHEALALEDSAPGLAAAVAAGVPVLLTRSAAGAVGPMPAALAEGGDLEGEFHGRAGAWPGGAQLLIALQAHWPGLPTADGPAGHGSPATRAGPWLSAPC